MPARRRGAVVPHGDGQEVEHQVGVRRRRRCCGRSRRPRSGSRHRARPQEQPLRADDGRFHSLRFGFSDTGCLAECWTYTSRWSWRFSPTPGRWCTGSTPTLRRCSASPTPDSWSSCGELNAPPHRITSPASIRRRRPLRIEHLDAGRPGALHGHPGHQRPREDRQVGPVHHRVEVGAGGGQPTAALQALVEGGEALLPVAVDVGGDLVAGLLDGIEEGTEERIRDGSPLEHERPRRRRASRPLPRGRSPCA